MCPFAVDKRDIKFCLFEYLDLPELCRIPSYSDFNRELFEMVLDEAAKFAVEVLAPLNPILDREHAQFSGGRVTLPKACHQVYQAYCQGGWVAPSAPIEDGGQGLPMAINAAIAEMMGAAAPAFLVTPGLTKAAGHLIASYGTEAMKRTYVGNLYAGKWSGTMCLTESGAGSAVGDLKTKARREGDHYLIEGEKIFISAGDQDLTENIIHLVLARVEGAPKGIAGVSLFLVPKIRVKEDGTLGEPNHVSCGGIEHKMGLHGSPTCNMIFGADGPCRGQLIGEENQGIKFMFLMMNEARIGVGLEGLSASAASYLEALQYARERVQGVDILDLKNVDAPRVPILRHPDVRRMLMTMKAFTEGMRGMLYLTARHADLALNSPDAEEQARSNQLVELLTPICKAYCSDWGFAMTTLGIQVLGGYGYCQEYPQEQYCRDSKAASIYEGTNGIQALDLLGRKVAGKGGMAFMTFLNELNQFIDARQGHPALGGHVGKLALMRDQVTRVVMEFQRTGAEGDRLFAILNATPFLELMGMTVMSWVLLDMAMVAQKKLEALLPQGGKPEDRRQLIERNPDAAFYDGKVHSMRFFLDLYQPQAQALADAILSGNRSPLECQF